MVCHKCDNPRCVNPDHLFLGTASDNTRDMIRKGRNNLRQRIDLGEDHASSKLTNGKVHTILKLRQDGYSIMDIADIFCVSDNTICNILNGRTWTHITGLSRVRGSSGRSMVGSNHPLAKIDEDQVSQMKLKKKEGATYKELSVEYGLHPGTIKNIVLGLRWKHIQ